MLQSKIARIKRIPLKIEYGFHGFDTDFTHFLFISVQVSAVRLIVMRVRLPCPYKDLIGINEHGQRTRWRELIPHTCGLIPERLLFLILPGCVVQ